MAPLNLSTVPNSKASRPTGKPGRAKKNRNTTGPTNQSHGVAQQARSSTHPQSGQQRNGLEHGLAQQAPTEQQLGMHFGGHAWFQHVSLAQQQYGVHIGGGAQQQGATFRPNNILIR